MLTVCAYPGNITPIRNGVPLGKRTTPRRGSRKRDVDGFQIRQRLENRKPEAKKAEGFPRAVYKITLLLNKIEFDAVESYMIENKIKKKTQLMRKLLNKVIPEVEEQI
jgi:hypothetical protein